MKKIINIIIMILVVTSCQKEAFEDMVVIPPSLVVEPVETPDVVDSVIDRYKLIDYLIDPRDSDEWEIASYREEVLREPILNGLHGSYEYVTEYTNGFLRFDLIYTPTYEGRVFSGHYNTDFTLDGDSEDFFEFHEVLFSDGSRIIGREVTIWETDTNGNRIRIAHEGSFYSRILVLPSDGLTFIVLGDDVTEDHFIEVSEYGNGPGWLFKTSEDLYIESSSGLLPLNGRAFSKEDQNRPRIYIGNTPTTVNPIAQYPNVEFIKGTETYFNHEAIVDRLNKISLIMGVVTEFQQLLYSEKIRYTVLGSTSSFYGDGGVQVGFGHTYFYYPVIHEFAHAYHDQIISNGYNNQEIIDMFNSIPHDTSVRYGDEENPYWRTNKQEFFAEILTTYIYDIANEQGIDTGYPDAVARLDSKFYYDVIKPYFNNLFN